MNVSFRSPPLGLKSINRTFRVSINVDTPKWMVYNGKSQSKMDDLDTSILEIGYSTSTNFCIVGYKVYYIYMFQSGLRTCQM